MKKLSAILLICLFAVSQYVRQFSYFGCIVVTTFSSSSFKCDCEKSLTDINIESRKPSTPTSHIHLLIDDNYLPSAFLKQPASYPNYFSVLFKPFIETICCGEPPPPWHPPVITC